MKVGDLVTVLPYGGNMYLVVDFIRLADARAAEEELGPLWALYSEDEGPCQMHEKWMKIINEGS